MFAVQSGGICFTSATAQNTYKKYGPSTKCSKSGTGGSWCQEVYNIGSILQTWNLYAIFDFKAIISIYDSFTFINHVIP